MPLRHSTAHLAPSADADHTVTADWSELLAEQLRHARTVLGAVNGWAPENRFDPAHAGSTAPIGTTDDGRGSLPLLRAPPRAIIVHRGKIESSCMHSHLSETNFEYIADTLPLWAQSRRSARSSLASGPSGRTTRTVETRPTDRTGHTLLTRALPDTGPGPARQKLQVSRPPLARHWADRAAVLLRVISAGHCMAARKPSAIGRSDSRSHGFYRWRIVGRDAVVESFPLARALLDRSTTATPYVSHCC